jgi:hypothetical protein
MAESDLVTLAWISHRRRDSSEFNVGEVSEGREALSTAGLETGATYLRIGSEAVLFQNRVV